MKQNLLKTVCLMSALSATILAHAEEDRSHGATAPNQQQVRDLEPAPDTVSSSNQQPTAIKDGDAPTHLTCKHVARSFWTKIPGLGRWTKKESNANSHFSFPVQNIKIDTQGSKEVFSAGFGPDKNSLSETVIKFDGDLKTLNDTQTSGLKWPKRWLNKLRHVERKSVYYGEWIDPKTAESPKPWTVKLVRIAKKKGETIQGVAEFQDSAGHWDKIDITCEGSLPSG